VIAQADCPVLSLAELDAYDDRPAGAGDEKRYCCPLPACRGKPRDRTHQSLCVNVESGAWICNRCTSRGKLSERWDAKPIAEIRRAKARARFHLTPERQPGTAASAPLLPVVAARCRPLIGTPGHRYLFDRGIGLAFAGRAGVRFCADVYGRPAIVFAMRDRRGQVVAVNCRHTDGRTDPKTHSVGDRSLGVYATPGSLVVDAPLVVCEGPMDALSLAACGVPAVALVATVAPRWLQTAAAFRRVLVALDADAEGDKHAALMADELAPFAKSIERLRPPDDCKDWNDAYQADVLGLRDWLAERCA
jgi:hypothetical protein